MNAFMLNLFLKSIPKANANEFEESRIVLKPKEEWKTDIVIFAITFVGSILAFFFLTTVPYVGTFFFIGGFLGTVLSLFYELRAITIFRNYENLFTDENINKLICKKEKTDK